MPSQFSYNNYYRKIEPSTPSSYHSSKTAKGISTTRLNNHSPHRSGWLSSSSPARSISSNPMREGRFQTLVQIKNDKAQQSAPALTSNSRLSTRIQLGSSANTNLDRMSNFVAQSPALGKRYHSSQQLLNQSGCKPQPLKQTYFGETPHTAKISQIPSNLGSSTSGLRARQQPSTTTNYAGYKYRTPALFSSATSLTGQPAIATTTTVVHTPSKTTPSQSVGNIYASSNNNLSYHKHHHRHQQPQQHQQHQPQQQTRFAVAGQRRARSPIKIPWR